MFLRTNTTKVVIANKLAFDTGDSTLLEYSITLSEQERASSCSFSIYDPGLKYLNLLLTQFIVQGGILVPLGLLENNTTAQQATIGTGVTVSASTGGAPSTLKEVEALGASDLSGLTAAGKTALNALSNSNVIAFLNAIAIAELGEAAAAKGGYGYLFGDTDKETFSIADLAKGHPGKVRSANGLSSSATGRFQVLDFVYKEEAAKLGLKDFKPVSQWIIAADRLIYRKVMEYVILGKFELAVAGNGGSLSARSEWASLGSYGQGTSGGKLGTFLNNAKRFQGAVASPTTSKTPTSAEILSSIAPSTAGGSKTEIDVSKGVIIRFEEGFNDATPSVQTEFLLTDVTGSNLPDITKISGKQVRYLLAKGSKNFKVHRNTSLRQLAIAIGGKIGAAVELPNTAGVNKINAAISQQESDYALLLKLAKKEGLLVRGNAKALKLEPLKVSDSTFIINKEVLLPGSTWSEAAASNRAIKGQEVAATGTAAPAPTSVAGVAVSGGGTGTVSSGSVFTPQVRAFMDLIAWKEVPDSLALTSYYENNGVRGSTGRFDDADIKAGGGFPASAGRSFNVGRYQFNKGDWESAKTVYTAIKGYSPADQDLVCYWKLGYRRCIEPLKAGDLRTAILNGGKEWASLPGSPYGQVQEGYSVEQAIAYYQQRLAALGGATPAATATPSASKTPTSAEILSSVAGGGASSGKQGILALNEGANDEKNIGRGFESVINIDIIKAPQLLAIQPGSILKLSNDLGYGDAIAQSRRISEVKRSWGASGLQCSINTYIPVAVTPKSSSSPSSSPDPAAGTTPGGGVALFTGNFASSLNRGDMIAGYVVTSPFGNRSSPGGFGSSNHKGTDVGCPSGTKLYAICKPGEQITVTYSSQGSVGGGEMALFDYNGFQFWYMHCTPGSIKTGIHKAGDVIALSGNSGGSTGAHLHFGQKRGGEWINPQKGFIHWALTGSSPA